MHGMSMLVRMDMDMDWGKLWVARGSGGQAVACMRDPLGLTPSGLDVWGSGVCVSVSKTRWSLLAGRWVCTGTVVAVYLTGT